MNYYKNVWRYLPFCVKLCITCNYLLIIVKQWAERSQQDMFSSISKNRGCETEQKGMKKKKSKIGHFKGLLSEFVGGAVISVAFFGLPAGLLIYKALVEFNVIEDVALAIATALVTAATALVSSSFYADTVCTENKQQIKAQAFEEVKNDIKTIESSTLQTYPWLAQQVADYFFLVDSKLADELRTKKHPAVKAAGEVKKIAKERRELQVKCKEQEYQLAYYETLFPWLEEFKQLPPAVGAQYALASDIKESSEYDTLKDWLSPEEYAALSNADKYQLALDRYKKRRKSDWEVGIEYERFVGYQYETAGYKVRYHGALMGKQDMGRDLILSKDGQNFVVQCKRWASDKEIHEKHIFQLYGSAVQLTVESGSEYIPIFITTAKLSDVARKCADYLSVRVCESYAYKDFPMIKCNISSSGEKIYHLPFDQQYDRVRIILSSGEAYVNTVAEAERLGFRRAHRWCECGAKNE